MEENMIVIRYPKTFCFYFDKPIIKKFKRRKFFARFKDNIWEADLVEMRSKKKVINIYYMP